MLIVLCLWSSSEFSSWFGHLVITSLNLKLILLVYLTYIITQAVLTYNLYFSSQEVYDFLITTLMFAYFVVLLFLVNSIFSVIFIIEALSTLIFLLIITSTYATNFFYKNTSLVEGHFLQHIMPVNYLNSLLLFFWTSLISSLNFFIAIIILFLQTSTLDWYLLEHIFIHITFSGNALNLAALGLAWFVFIFCIFVKCGLAPFFIWKPSFFKGLPIHTLFFYISFFYFFLYIFIVLLLTFYFSEILYYYTTVLTFFLLLASVVIMSTICESYYLKIFLAVSSILNSVLVLFALVSTHPHQHLLFF